jgi:hypothetical protein
VVESSKSEELKEVTESLVSLKKMRFLQSLGLIFKKIAEFFDVNECSKK